MPSPDTLSPESFALALYDSVLAGAPLTRVLDGMRSALGADSVWISRVFLLNARRADAERFEQVGLNPDSTASYLAHWVQQDPWLMAAQNLPSGVHNYDRLVPQKGYLRTAFWNDFAKRQEPAAQHVLAAGTAVSGELTGMLALQRTGRSGAFGAQQEKFLKAIFPHLSRALLAESRLADAGLQAAAAGAGLDALHHGVAVIDAGGRMVRCNTTLLAQVHRGDGLRLTRCGPAADDPAAQVRLSRSIEAAVAATARRDPVPVAATLAIPRRSGGSWLVQVLAVNAATTGLFSGFAGALVLVTEPRRNSPTPATVQTALNLTLAEAKLAVALATGVTLAEHAAARRVSVETVRSHLASIRRKTGARRQSELVGLVASLPHHQ